MTGEQSRECGSIDREGIERVEKESAAMPQANVKFPLVDHLNLREYPRYELIEGDLLLTPSPVFRHQRVGAHNEKALREWVEGKSVGIVIDAPMDVILEETTVVQPDVLVILHANRHIIRDRIYGPPDLVVEVLSPGTQSRDLTLKRRIYARHGIKEYWIADPDGGVIEVNAWTPDGYSVYGRFIGNETLTSPLLGGFELPLQAAFAY